MSSPAPQSKKKTLPELLAPAGSPEAFRAAVAAGADAVYLSGKRFGARQFAANFSEAEIEESVSFAHARGVRVYVTVNTLIHDAEIPGTVDYLIWLYSIGVDAVLIQDIGIAALAREIIPGLVIHASTQMTIHNAEGVRWAAAQGISRVVLARELSLSEVERIVNDTKDTGVGLEVFAHGALCYGYSGQCLLSSVIGGRSGNRGMCAQPCRKPYAIVTGPVDAYGRPTELHNLPAREQYLLSPKDLCTYRHLPALVASPIASLKIEGRMKSPEYVAVVVAAYRRALDAISAGMPLPPDEMDNLLLAFNRGFTKGYLFGDRHRSLMGRSVPDNRGLYIGMVSRYDERTRMVSVRLESRMVPKPGDGLFFIGHEHPDEQFGFSLNTVPQKTNDEFRFAIPSPVSPGTKVYITSSVDLAARARLIISHPSTDLRHPVPLALTVRVDENGSLQLDGKIHPGNGREIAVTHTPGITLVPAQSRPLTAELMEQQMRKSGGTPFVIDTVSMQYRGNLFAPTGELNRARREFLTLAESALVEASRPAAAQVESAKNRWQTKAADYPATTGPAVPTAPTARPAYPLQLAVLADSPDTVQKAAESGADRIYFEPDLPTSATVSCCSHPVTGGIVEQIRSAVELCRARNIPLVWKFPRITRPAFSEAVLPKVAQIAGTGIAGIMVENPGMIAALSTAAPTVPLSGATGLNVFNHAAVQKLSPPCHLLTLSPELSREESRFLISEAHRQGSVAGFALVVQGICEGIITNDCLLEPYLHCQGDPAKQKDIFYGIRDSTGHVFPVRTDSECRTHIGNSAELCLLDHLPEISGMGMSEVMIDARGRTGTYTAEITSIYRTALQAMATRTPGVEKTLQGLKDQIKKSAPCEITTGHFIRGLKES
ncbi:MAG: U32 family peptidase [Methanomicrobiales archaeon]